MINKSILQSVISKYYLGGIIEATKLDIKDEKLQIKFVSPNKDMIGYLIHSQFPISDCILPIFNTTQLLKLLNVTNNNISLLTERKQKTFTKLYISDKNFSLSYALADEFLLPKVGEVTEPQEYEVKIKLSSENVDALIKAKNALNGVDFMIIRSDSNMENNKPIIEFVFGDNNEYSNKITYNVSEDILCSQKINLPFNSEMFKEILIANKDMGGGSISISKSGLMIMEFKKNEIQTKYYLVRLQGA
jgi:hypothetical protein